MGTMSLFMKHQDYLKWKIIRMNSLFLYALLLVAFWPRLLTVQTFPPTHPFLMPCGHNCDVWLLS